MVEAIEENIKDIKIKKSIDLILDTLGLPPCDDIHKARKMIRKAINNNRNVQKHIKEVIKLSYGVIHHPEKDLKIELDISSENWEEVEAIESFVA